MSPINVQSNNDAQQQELYRKQDNTGEIIAGAAAIGGLAWLLSRGKAGGNIASNATDNVATKTADNLTEKSTEEIVQTAKQAAINSPSKPIYNAQQLQADESRQIVENMKNIEGSLEESIGNIKKKKRTTRKHK